MTMTDRYDLERYVAAQADDYRIALAEIGRGAKRSHWMWYIFPQLAGLGGSAMSRRYAIRRRTRRAPTWITRCWARAFECVAALQDLTGTTAEEVFGGLDAAKLRSSLTLFLEAGGEPLFRAALDRWFGGNADDRTLDLLHNPPLAN